MADEEIVRVERDGGLATVTLNRPEHMNTMNTAMLDQLPGILDALAQDPDVRCVLLTGAGERAFTAGGDIHEMSARGPAGAAEGKRPMEHAVAALRRSMECSATLHLMPKPTLAAINGAAAGAGLALALACDLRMAGDRAVFTTAFSKIGYSGDFGGSYFLTQIVGTAKARELYFLGDRFDSKRALELGVVNWVVDHDKLRAEAHALGQRLADGPPIAYRYMKRNLNLATHSDVRDLLDLEAEAMVRTGLTQDFRNAALAFLQKKTTTFRGE